MSDNNIEFISPSERFGQKIDFKDILMRQIDKVRNAASVEWYGGYWNINNTEYGENRTYFPDTREVYCNSVIALDLLLVNYYDNKYKEKIKHLEAEKVRLSESYKKEDLIDEWRIKKIIFYNEQFKELLKLIGRQKLISNTKVMRDRI